MAKSLTMAELKEMLDIHENIVIKMFANGIGNLE